MRTVALAAMMLGGCAPQPEVASHGAEAPHAPLPGASAGCSDTNARTLVGRPVDATLTSEAIRLTGARSVRVIPPGAMVTMDYRADRLNVDTDAAGRATRFHCG